MTGSAPTKARCRAFKTAIGALLGTITQNGSTTTVNAYKLHNSTAVTGYLHIPSIEQAPPRGKIMFSDFPLSVILFTGPGVPPQLPPWTETPWTRDPSTYPLGVGLETPPRPDPPKCPPSRDLLHGMLGYCPAMHAGIGGSKGAPVDRQPPGVQILSIFKQRLRAVIKQL